MASSQTMLKMLLEKADIRLDGSRPGDIVVHNDRFYGRVLAGGNLGLGESYMDGWWDCERIDMLVEKILRAQIDKAVRGDLQLLLTALKAKLFNLQSRARAFRVGEAHYDLGNDLYKAMLDKRMVYTCGYWKDANDLNKAQENKLDLVCRKLQLKKGQRVLDIGCGWGGFAKFAAEKYGVEMVGITVSKEQLELAKQNCAGLPVELRLQDYREVNEPFDHIMSLGMFEHVGYKNYRTYMEVVKRCLKPQGLFLLHTIGGNYSTTGTDAWIDRYIFPNSMLPSVAQISGAAENLFVMEDWHNFGAYYDKTLMAWYDNVERHWPELQSQYNERFHRMWRYYLLTCAGAFRVRMNQLWQIVYSHDDRPGVYPSIR